jgi:predicted pyridoxine 5'-phosphate oxidase superfamily flavin-nucleotide-binding protein
MPQQGGSGFHAGELAVQRLAGAQRDAARLEGMLGRAALSEGVARFLGQQSFAAMTARDDSGMLWASPLVGVPGFLRVVGPASLQIAATPGPGDPLHRLGTPQPIGLVAIDYPRRRRFRLNGTLVGSSGGLTVEVEEAFGNCPQYIPRTGGARETPRVPAEDAGSSTTGELDAADQRAVGAAETFILGTTHHRHGNDASHRGGPAGFVRVEAGRLWWPDYPGNNLFTSLGNLTVDPEAALLFLDQDRGLALHVHGHADLQQVDVGSAGDDGQTGRRVELTVDRVVRSRPARLPSGSAL